VGLNWRGLFTCVSLGASIFHLWVIIFFFDLPGMHTSCATDLVIEKLRKEKNYYSKNVDSVTAKNKVTE
jgi:hypothetical protein